MSQVSLIAVDWGTSNLRASLLDAEGSALETRSAPGGIMAVNDGAFSQALLALCADWMQQYPCPLIASGMIGSRQGWKEAPYLDCPAGAGEAARLLVSVDIEGAAVQTSGLVRQLHIVPGLRCLDESEQFDVMRGEETQIWGAGLASGSVAVLPGTHSKWAWTGAKGAITGFRTYMTGELYALLTKHGILGRLMVFGESRPDAFVAGVKVGVNAHAQASHAIFSARTAGLMGRIAPEGLPDYLSGVLIGLELGGARALCKDAELREVVLIGDDGLCERYERAFELIGIATARAADDATTRGQTIVAQAAGLLGDAS
ncbi:MAG TPA: 2-dehydro-3-deoxygalactonokinase [Polaromonas sp.]|uniref:2-dehydro-3-deoxygalactonokinase n=1 Tax=Polaromonas sp. TaxID=1869339 RepID=UPI002D62B52E|nr:2-dehydro-3-deoxygalactonokinase [Polaromonas sp.]HYW55570.1 2-dehydro-3-deoxygalactonokinase [Polaromonas sp.]